MYGFPLKTDVENIKHPFKYYLLKEFFYSVFSFSNLFTISFHTVLYDVFTYIFTISKILFKNFY